MKTNEHESEMQNGVAETGFREKVQERALARELRK